MNTTKLFAFAVLLSFAFGSSGPATAQDDLALKAVTSEQPKAQPTPSPVPSAGIFYAQGHGDHPPISIRIGKGVHTNFKIFVPAGRAGICLRSRTITFAETPASMGCVYKVGPIYTGCNPATGGTNHTVGGWGAIALVDAYDDPNAASDLAVFDTHFGLPKAAFRWSMPTTSFGTLGGLNASCSGTPPPAKYFGLGRWRSLWTSSGRTLWRRPRRSFWWRPAAKASLTCSCRAGGRHTGQLMTAVAISPIAGDTRRAALLTAGDGGGDLDRTTGR